MPSLLHQSTPAILDLSLTNPPPGHVGAAANELICCARLRGLTKLRHLLPAAKAPRAHFFRNVTTWIVPS
ncbi:hypothetical protein C7E20_15240 [Sphingobium sp. AEW4]|nr:hypothetical protein C7E20_15240 [Sphingobium sp. AEW4]